MQPTLNTITTTIASHLDMQLDEPFKRLLAEKVDFWRSTLVGRSLEKQPQQRPLFTQRINVEMKKVAPVTVPCLEEISRSVKPVPRPMRIGTILFDYTGAIDGDTPFGKATVGTHGYLTAGKYSCKQLYVEYTNNHLEIRQNKFIPWISVVGVFDKPIDVFEFNGGTDFWNQPYPITGDMLQMITQYILQVDYNRPVLPDTGKVEVNQEPAVNG